MRLLFQTGALAGHGVELPPGVTLVGRADDCDLVVPDAGVSGEHAELTVLPGDRITVRDLGSRNGTFADGERVEGSWTLAAGSEIGFGMVTARLVADDQPAAAGRRRGRLVIAAVALVLLGAVGTLAASGALGGGDDGDDDVVAATPTPTPSPTATPTATPDPFTPRDAIRRASKATLLVNFDGIPNGSGWVVDKDADGALVVTNDHVVAGATEITVNLDQEEPREATLVSAHGCDDLALLRVPEARNLRTLQLGFRPQQGDDVWVMGFPEASTDDVGLQVKSATIARLNAEIARKDRTVDAVYSDLIQVDGAVIGGNSGGPLISKANGRVLGVNSLNEGDRELVGYAIASTRVATVLEFLRDGTSVPGMSLAFGEDGSPPVVVGVTSPTLQDGGVVADGSERLVSVDGQRFGTDLEPSLRALCGYLPKLGDGVSTPVAYRFRRTDGTTFRVTLEY